MTPATKVLDKARVNYSLHRYEHDPQAESYGGEAAEKLGLDLASQTHATFAPIGRND